VLPEKNFPDNINLTTTDETYDRPSRLKQANTEPTDRLRGLRQFVYVAFGASGFIGALVFLAQLLAGRNVGAALPNCALQVGVVALMVWLFRLEQRASRPKKP